MALTLDGTTGLTLPTWTTADRTFRAAWQADFADALIKE